MRRRVARPYGQSISVTRLVSLVLALAVLWMLYERMRDPATWKMFANEEPAANPVEKVLRDDNVPRDDKQAVVDNETVVPGPNHKNEEALAEAQRNFEFVIDRAPLKVREMDAYWRLMAWSRTEPLVELEKDARSDVPFTQFWDQPERYRGQLIRLRLHVLRVQEYDAPENSNGISKVYEAWGSTDESSSFPYVVVFPERPAGLAIGEEKRSEVVFVGYFLKIMSYTDKLGKTRGAPLLVGRTRLVAAPAKPASNSDASTVLIVILVCGALLVGSFIWIGMRPRKKSIVKPLPGELLSFGSLDSTFSSGDMFATDSKTTESSEVGQPVVANPEA